MRGERTPYSPNAVIISANSLPYNLALYQQADIIAFLTIRKGSFRFCKANSGPLRARCLGANGQNVDRPTYAKIDRRPLC